MSQAGDIKALWQAKPLRVRKSLSWRQRKDHLGEMIQMDGSHHDWLEGRGPKLVLMGYIDDATGRFYGKFYAYEGTMPALDSLKGYIRQYGITRSIYLDRHSTYKTVRKYSYAQWPFRDKEELTQFGRSCQQLGIELIYANSPQAKGRIERVFETLQDRLTKELRLANAATCKEANGLLEQYLERFNNRFTVASRRAGNLHRPVDKRIPVDEILSVQTHRPLRNDRTILHNNRWYQVLTRTRAENVMVYEYLNGRMAIKHGVNRLEYKTIQGPVVRTQAPKAPPSFRGRRSYIPPKDSFWRNGFKLPGSLSTK